MSDKQLLDQYLAFFFRRPVKTQSIESLQQDVWRRIRLQESQERPENWLESALYSLFMPRRQLATLTLVLVLGIALGFAAPESTSLSTSSLSAKALGLDIYASSYAHPFSLAQLGNP